MTRHATMIRLREKKHSPGDLGENASDMQLAVALCIGQRRYASHNPSGRARTRRRRWAEWAQRAPLI